MQAIRDFLSKKKPSKQTTKSPVQPPQTQKVDPKQIQKRAIDLPAKRKTGIQTRRGLRDDQAIKDKQFVDKLDRVKDPQTRQPNPRTTTQKAVEALRGIIGLGKPFNTK